MSFYRFLAVFGAAACLGGFYQTELAAQGFVYPNQSPGPFSTAHSNIQNAYFDTWNTPAPERHVAGPPKISADILRFPISSKAQSMLTKVGHLMKGGDHKAAVAMLQEGLVKYARAAPYFENLLGIEYVGIGDYPAARDAFEHVLQAMPHISANHSNYALTLAALGDNEHAEKSLRTALALDDQNDIAKRMLEDLKHSEQPQQ
jgi:tetratricopeptide (TPR) repeat protein